MSMIEVYPRVYVGNLQDGERVASRCPDWGIVHAAKEPYHREFVGYSTKGAPSDSPEYYLARRDNRLALNLVDARSSLYFPKVIMTEALAFIDEQHHAGRKVLIHCNQGESRAPLLALLWMAMRTLALDMTNFEQAEAGFVARYLTYDQPLTVYHPGDGFRRHIEEHWQWYREMTSLQYRDLLTCQTLGPLGIIERGICCHTCHVAAQHPELALGLTLQKRQVTPGIWANVCCNITGIMLQEGLERVRVWRSPDHRYSLEETEPTR